MEVKPDADKGSIRIGIGQLFDYRRYRTDRHVSSLREHKKGEKTVQRLRLKLMTVCALLASLIPILWETSIGSDVMKPIAGPIVGGMITSTIHALILVPVFFALMLECALRRGTLQKHSTI